MPIAGAILAGGLATRMGGGDKCLQPVAGRPILSRIVERLAPQCEPLLLNANGDPDRFAAYGLPVIADGQTDHHGPLGGLLAALDHLARHAPGLEHLLTVPGDTPFLPGDLVTRLAETRVAAGARIACAASGGRLHPVIALWPVALREDVRRALSDGERSVRRLASRFPLAVAEWGAPDPFLNINTPDDLVRAQDLAAPGPSSPGA